MEIIAMNIQATETNPPENIHIPCATIDMNHTKIHPDGGNFSFKKEGTTLVQLLVFACRMHSSNDRTPESIEYYGKYS